MGLPSKISIWQGHFPASSLINFVSKLTMRLTCQYLEQIVNNCEARRLDPVAGAEDKIKKISADVQGYSRRVRPGLPVPKFRLHELVFRSDDLHAYSGY